MSESGGKNVKRLTAGGQTVATDIKGNITTLPATQVSSLTKIVLIVPFDSLQRVASRHFSFLPVSLLLLDRWDKMESLPNYRSSVQIFGARYDQVIPCEHARNLAENCSVAAYSEINCGHNDWSYSPEI
jgi:pimeloyl-ACP methyl ester carboxylesterase